MTRQLRNRLDKLEKTVRVEHSLDHNQTTITRYHGEEGRKMEREYILTTARARLGLCEPTRAIFISKRIKRIKEDHPGFPDRMTREHAKQLIEDYKMKSIERRVQKIEELIQTKYGRVNPEYENMTNEEVNRLVYDVLNGPVEALFVHTRQGFVDVYRLPEDELEKVYREYADGTRPVFTLDELREMGHEPADDYDDEHLLSGGY